MGQREIRFFSIDTPTKKAFLGRCYRYSVSEKLPFLQCLEQESDKSLSRIEDEGTKAGSSNGHSAVSFEPGQGAPAAAEFPTMWGDLISLYYRAQSNLINPPTVSLAGCIPVAIPNPTDAQIYDLMQKNLVAIRETQNDYTWGRLTPGFDYVQ
jgi:hypothetical protein